MDQSLRVAHIDRVKEYGYYGVAIVLFVATLVVRYFLYPVMTDDFIYFIGPWFETLNQHAWLTAFSEPFSNYTPLYLYLLKFLTFIPVPSLVSVKTLSFFFDILIAYFAYLILKHTKIPPYTPAQLFLSFVIVLSIPTVFINSSLWGQADAVYAAAAVVSIYFILINRPLFAAVAFGISFSVKLQSVFLLPIVAGFFIRERRAHYLLIIPALYILSIIPAWLGGGSFRRLFLTYFTQSGQYDALVMSAPTIYSFFDKAPLSEGTRDLLALGGVILAGLCALAIALVVIYAKKLNVGRVLLISLLSVLLIPFVLPKMHERYFYLADVISVIYALYNPSRWYVPVVVVTVSFLSYAPYLSNAVPWFSSFIVDFRFLTILFFVLLLYLIVYTALWFFKEGTQSGRPGV
jgi:Gpi18-like mannosyltransferase